jgi:hypothetical protein
MKKAPSIRMLQVCAIENSTQDGLNNKAIYYQTSQEIVGKITFQSAAQLNSVFKAGLLSLF